MIYSGNMLTPAPQGDIIQELIRNYGLEPIGDELQVQGDGIPIAQLVSFLGIDPSPIDVGFLALLAVGVGIWDMIIVPSLKKVSSRIL